MNRISKTKGPHNIDIYSLIFGSLLGDSYAEKRNGSTRFILQQEESNVSYLMWFHQYLATRGYCSSKKPKLETRIGPNGKLRFFYRVRTYSFASFNWIYDAFYPNIKNAYAPSDQKARLAKARFAAAGGPPPPSGGGGPPAPPLRGGPPASGEGRPLVVGPLPDPSDPIGVKIVPLGVKLYPGATVGAQGPLRGPTGAEVRLPGDLCWTLLTPLALAVWIMDDGTPVSAGLKIATNGRFRLEDVLSLCDVLNKKYNLYARPHRAGKDSQFAVYIPKAGMPHLGLLISAHMVPSMHRKLNGSFFV